MTAPAAPAKPAPGEVLLAHLRDHLDQELAVHRQLLAMAEDKRRAVLAGDGRTLSDLVAREEAPLAEAGRLRQVRDRLLRTAAAMWNLAPAALNLGTLADRASQALAAELRRRAHELRGVLERLKAANDRNQVLIRQGLAVVRDLVGALTGAPAAGAYDRRGLNPWAPAPGGSLLDCRG